MKLIATIALTLATSAAHTQSPQLLQQLDAASKTFKSAQANVTYDNYTRVAREDDIEIGTLYIERSGSIERTGSQESMGAVTYPTGSKTPSKIYTYDGGTLRMYAPGSNQEDIFKAGDNQAKYESFLTLGFGGSGTELAKAWTIKDFGPEIIDGVPTQKLDLISKDPAVLGTISHVMIWIDPKRDVSLKQIFFGPRCPAAMDYTKPTCDIRTTTYSNIKLNASINRKPYAIPKNSQKIQH